MPKPDLFQLNLLRDLIALDTVNPPGNERIAAEFLGAILSAWGFSIEIQEVAYNRANLVAKLSRGDGPEIALCGHLDVVAADPANWQSNPFILRTDASRVFGRGVCDMKGALSCMVGAARDFVENIKDFKGTLTLLFVADEEINTLGARHYLANGNKPDLVIIGEPTGMDVCIAARGVIRYHLDIIGRSGHAACPQEALNPIPIAGRFVQLLEKHNSALAKIKHPILPSPSIAVTMIAAGEQANSIPGVCRLTIDRRILPDECLETIKQEINTLLQQMPGNEAQLIGEPDVFISVPAAQPLANSTLAEKCRSVLSAMGINAVIRHFPACCDQYVFAAAGIDCLLVGPGSINQAHAEDEYVELEQLALAREFYFRFIKEQLT